MCVHAISENNDSSVHSINTLTMAPVIDLKLDHTGYANKFVSQCLIIIKDNKVIWEMSGRRKESNFKEFSIFYCY